MIFKLGLSRSLLFNLYLIFCCGMASAQGNVWTDLHPVFNAGNRDSHNMIWDSESQRAIIYGGHQGGVNPSWQETWAYDYTNNKWTKMNPPTNPGNRAEFAFVYNSRHDRAILYHGNSTWAYDYNSDNWTNLNPDFYPDSLNLIRMAYDSESDKVILYDHLHGKTWAYDYATNFWEFMNPSNPKPVSDWRPLTAVTYDSKHDRVIMVLPVPQQTWTYDYNNNRWHQLSNSPNEPLSGGGLYDMDYDVLNDKIIMYGDNQRTWAFDYTTDQWMEMNPNSTSPTAHHHAMAYMTQFNRILFYGGMVGDNNNTWVYSYDVSTKASNQSAQTTAIYPNPCDGVFLVESNYSINEIKVFDVFGKEIFKLSVPASATSVEIDLSYFQKGMYLLMLLSGKYSFTERVIIH